MATGFLYLNNYTVFRAPESSGKMNYGFQVFLQHPTHAATIPVLKGQMSSNEKIYFIVCYLLFVHMQYLCTIFCH